MPTNLLNAPRSGFPGQGKKRALTSTLAEDFVTGVGDGKPHQNKAPGSALAVTLAKFAHEFANELNVVSGGVQLLEKELEEPHEARNTLQYVKSGIRRLGGLLNELHSLSQAQRLKLQPTRFACVIRELMALEEPRYAASGVRVKVDLPSDLPPIMLDISKFRQALLNLCRNAVEAMPRGGRLTLRAYSTDSKVHLEVHDTGKGIPPGLDVFALFTTTKATGTGVGLPIVREIICSHGGTVTYASKPGNGTTFRLTLPNPGDHRVDSAEE